MRLRIQNIGRIYEADIELPGITIVAGANGSGKSTISKSLYATMETYLAPEQNIEFQKRRSENSLIRNWINQYIGRDSNTVDKRNTIKKMYLQSNCNRDRFISDVLVYFESLTNPLLIEAQIASEQDKLMIEYAGKLFDLLDKHYAKDSEYYLSYSTQLIFEGVFLQQVNCIKETPLAIITYTRNNISATIHIDNNKVVKIGELCPELIGERAIYITTSDLMDSVGTYRRLYTAEKSGSVSYANSQLTKLLMEETPIKEMLAEEYYKIEEQKEIFAGIFSDILDGEIYMDKSRLAYHDNWCDSDIEFQNIASGMKIFLILQRLINNGAFLKETTLIIDEPETNLHPQWQLILAHLLVLMKSQLNVHIYVNSHSPYFVRAMEYYANQYNELSNSRFYTMRKNDDGLYYSENVTDRLGEIYDKLAEPFNKIM